MKGRPPPFAWMSRTYDTTLRWLIAFKGSGFSGCFILICACILPIWSLTEDAPFPYDDAQWLYDGLLTFEAVIAALIVTSLSNVFFFSLAASSHMLRKAIRGLTLCVSDIPALGCAGLMLAWTSSFWASVFIAALSLSARSIHATLAIEDTIPPILIKSAHALRLSPWKRFWRVLIPVSFPEMVRKVLKDFPDFWVRLIGTQIIAALCLDRQVHGVGGLFIRAFHTGNHMMMMTALLMSGLIIGVVQHGLIAPLLEQGRRYDVCSTLPKKDRVEERPFPWWQDPRLLVLVPLIIVSVGVINRLSSSWGVTFMEGIRGIMIMISALGIGLVSWSFLGGIMLGMPVPIRRWVRWACMMYAFSPIFLFFPWLLTFFPSALLPALALLGIFGWCLLAQDQDPPRDRLFKTAQRLEVSFLSEWRVVRLPLIAPALVRGGLMALFLLWNNIYLAEIFAAQMKETTTGLGDIFTTIIRSHDYEMQGFFIILVTILAFGVRHGLIIPFQTRIARKYRVIS